MKVFLRAIKKGYKLWIRTIIYIGSYFFAVLVSWWAFSSEINTQFLIGVGAIGSLSNYLLYKRFAKSYHLWGFLTKNRFLFDVRLILFLPPVSTFFISIALCIYIGSLFIPSFNQVWQMSLEGLPDIVGFLSSFLFFLWSEKFIYILLGFIPIHWIYELFVAPMNSKINKISVKSNEVYPRSFSLFYYG